MDPMTTFACLCVIALFSVITAGYAGELHHDTWRKLHFSLCFISVMFVVSFVVFSLESIAFPAAVIFSLIVFIIDFAVYIWRKERQEA